MRTVRRSLRCPGAASLASAAFVSALGVSAGYAAVNEPGRADALTIVVTGLKSNEGQVRVAVFDGKDRWLKEAVYARILDIEGHTCEWVIEDVPYGDYGIAVFHDENGNGTNDRNLLGIPKEAYGFSNHAPRKFGPATWEQAKFAVSSPSAALEIRVK